MQAITLWLLEQAPLGHKCPRPGRQSRYHHCPACVDMVDRRPRLTCRHVLEACPAVDATRVSSGISAFLADCAARGVPRALHYGMYVSGVTADGSELGLSSYLERGAALAELQDSWIQCLT